jgi:hypothetical protein
MTKPMGRPTLPETAFNAAIRYIAKVYDRKDLGTLTQNMVILVREANQTILNLATYFLEKKATNAGSNPTRTAPVESEPDQEDAFADIQGVL